MLFHRSLCFYYTIHIHTFIRAHACLDPNTHTYLQEYSQAAGHDPAKFFFEDLMHLNDSAEYDIREAGRLDSKNLLPSHPDVEAYMASGEMAVRKGRAQFEGINKVQVQLVVLRLPEKNTDILISMNTPVFIHEDSSVAVDVGAGFKQLHLTAPDLFQSIVKSFTIVDWSLFG